MSAGTVSILEYVRLLLKYTVLVKEHKALQGQYNILVIKHSIATTPEYIKERYRHCHVNKVTGLKRSYILKYGVEAAELILSYRGKIGAHARSKVHHRGY